MRDLPLAVTTAGTIDVVTRDAETITVQGWVAAVQGDPVDAVTVRIGSDPGLDCATEYGLPSDDVQQAHAQLIGADRSRFRGVLTLDPTARERAGDALVAVTPWVRGRAGRTLFSVFAPTLPQPSEDNLDAVGGGFAVAFEFLGHLVDLAGLATRHDVLEVGCGTGRIAWALAYYLDRCAHYEGFDVMERLVHWSRREITPRHPNFSFRLVDVRNGAYQPHGTIEASAFEFPYPDASFDCVYLTSVFTHMRSADVRNYLAEIHRVLRPGGRCLATCWLLDVVSRHAMVESGSTLQFQPMDDIYTADPHVPERAIAFDRDQFVGWAVDAGLAVRAEHPGWWSGRPGWVSYQDILVLEAPHTRAPARLG